MHKHIGLYASSEDVDLYVSNQKCKYNWQQHAAPNKYPGHYSDNKQQFCIKIWAIIPLYVSAIAVQQDWPTFCTLCTEMHFA